MTTQNPLTHPVPQGMTPWIGVDLDGTLAHYDSWQGVNHIGAPIAPMVERVKAWLNDGIEVRIVTARYASHNQPDSCLDVVTPIAEWCLKHIGQILPVTNAKDGGMMELWDDRAIQVLTNTGNPVAPPQQKWTWMPQSIITSPAQSCNPVQKPSPPMTTHILYHANCADGFASACIAHCALKASPTPLIFHPISYDDTQQMPANFQAGDEVFYLDYTPPMWVIQKLAQQETFLTIIDHHKTAQPIHSQISQLNLSLNLPVASIFNLEHSGSDLTSAYLARGLHDNSVPLQLLSFYDLGGPWNFPQDPKAQTALNLQAGLMRATPRTFAAWVPLLFAGMENPALQTCISLGEKLRQADQEVIAAACRRPLWLEFEGHLIPAITGIPPELTNDACHFLLGMYPTAPFVANFFVDATSGRIRYRLRSRKDGFNVCDLAKRLDPPTDDLPGGGGHPCAAGFSTLNPLPLVTA